MDKLFNLEKFIEQTAGDREIARQVYCLYRDSIHTDLDDMKTAAATGDYAALRRLAHKSKSGFIIMGSENLFNMSTELEELSNEQNPAVISKVENYAEMSFLLFDQLKKEFG